MLSEPQFAKAFTLVAFAIVEDHNAFRVHNPDGNLLPFQRAFGLVEDHDAVRQRYPSGQVSGNLPSQQEFGVFGRRKEAVAQLPLSLGPTSYPPTSNPSDSAAMELKAPAIHDRAANVMKAPAIRETPTRRPRSASWSPPAQYGFGCYRVHG